jgi:multiple sugar transport system substrate-binding protein
MQQILGLTWNHPRGTDSLREAARLARLAGKIDIHWDAQPLEGFEAHPIKDLASRYDLIVMDHPHLGDARQSDCLRPLSPLFGEDLVVWSEATVGASFASYSDKDGQWALPLDAATQVMIYGRAVDAPPCTIGELFDLAARKRVIPCLAGPHAALMFMALNAGLGKACDTGDTANKLVDPETGAEALEIMARLSVRMHEKERNMNPIAMHQAVAEGTVDLCPWVYGYAPYGQPGPRQVRFADVVKLPAGYGSTLGGTGLAITVRADVTPALIDHIRFLMSDEAQLDLIPAFSGQPSRRLAWEDDRVNAASGGFYRETRATTEAAWVRPRWPGFTPFQGEMSAILRAGLLERAPAHQILGNIEAAFETARSLA